MNTIIPDYEPLSFRGAGAFGYVVEAYDRVNDIRVAMKRTQKVGTSLSREYQILSELKDCNYIVKLIEIFYSVNDDGQIIQNLVFEYVSRSLEDYMEEFRRKKTFIPIEKIKKIAKQLLLGLDFCHKKKIVHRDLKPENVLFTEDEVVKICDFGSSKFINDNTTSTPYIVSRYYRAPELILGKSNYNEKIDIFAAGSIIVELFILTPLFPGKIEGLQIMEYISVLGNPGRAYFSKFHLPKKFEDYFSNFNCGSMIQFEKLLNEGSFYSYNDIKNAIDLIFNMLKWDYKERYTAELCLNHTFFKEKDKIIK